MIFASVCEYLAVGISSVILMLSSRILSRICRSIVGLLGALIGENSVSVMSTSGVSRGTALMTGIRSSPELSRMFV